MLIGYNMDVSYVDCVFYVQIEDKGMLNFYIESFVYVGGQVVLLKWIDYGDCVEDKDVLFKLMEMQYWEMIVVICVGIFDQKVMELFGLLKKKVLQQMKYLLVFVFLQIKINVDCLFDEVIFEYFINEVEQEYFVMLFEENVELVIGEVMSLLVCVSLSKMGWLIFGVEVVFKMILIVVEFKVFVKGKIDQDGLFEVLVIILDLCEGCVVLIIMGLSGLGKVLFKYLF